ncbi:MAG TPA: VIT1/CCC1 transporter family protein [Acidimicrobiales bacterium]|jgi:vacuolar iron transporter family protein|nr:VIT1/CCC1 transporter family protein [Acidimicrobiales bacterium]
MTTSPDAPVGAVGDPSEADHEHGEHHHRDVQGGAARAAVFGVSDGLVSNVGLILGVAGAEPAPSIVRLAGLAGLIAGAISMAAGEYNSMRVQTELLERELELERLEIRRNPELETEELAALYRSRGMEAEVAREMAETIMSDPEVALETHAREELGVDPDQLGSPLGAAGSSLVAFSLGAVVPLVPWFFGSGTGAIVASVVGALLAAVVVGAAIGRFTGRSLARTVGRQILFTLVPAVLTFAIGSAVGVSGV